MAEFKEVKIETIPDVPVGAALPLPTDNQALTSLTDNVGTLNPGTRQLNSNSVVEKYTAGDIIKSANFISGSSGWQIDGQGNAEFNNVTVRGTIYASAGTIGGWTINAATITGGSVTLDSTGVITVGTGNNVAILSAVDATYRLWVGHATAASATFRVTQAGAVTATSGTIGGWTLAASTLTGGAVTLNSGGTMTIGSGSPNLTIDGTNTRIRSSNYSAGVAGFTIEPNLLEAENIVARGIMKGTTFQYDVVAAVGGQLIVSNSDVLASDMTALDAATLTTKGTTTWAVNDMLLIQAVTASGIQNEYLRITSIASAPTYTVTRDLAAAYSANSNPAWQTGTTVVKIGKSDGAATYSGGYLRLLGEGTNAPYYSVFQRSGVAYNSVTEAVRLGNLNGIGSFVADTFGIYIGNTTTGNYLTYDTTSGNLIVNDSVISNQTVFGDGSDGDVTLSVNASLTTDTYYNNLTINNGITLNPNGYRIFVKGTLTFIGTGKIAANGGAGNNGSNAVGGAGGSGGSGGTAAHGAGTLPASVAGGDGGAGPNSSTGCPASTNGTAGSSATKALAGIGSGGGAGGNGSNGCTSPGTGGAAGSISGTVFNKIRNVISAFQLLDNNPTITAFTIASGSGGGGGGQSGRTSSFLSAGGGGGGGGGAGAPGGFTWVAARKIVTVNGNNYLEAKGGIGGNGGTGSAANNAGSGGGGGGGGGRGGVVVLIYSSKTGTGTISVAGGAPGTGGAAGTGSDGNGSAGASGTAGSTGLSVTLQV